MKTQTILALLFLVGTTGALVTATPTASSIGLNNTGTIAYTNAGCTGTTSLPTLCFSFATGGYLEQHWEVVQGFSSSPFSPGAITAAPLPGWLPNSTTSTWVKPSDAFPGVDGDTWIFQTTFSLSANQLASMPAIEGRWSHEHLGDMYLNTSYIGTASLGGSSWTPFTINPYSFVDGVNTLRVLSYTGNPNAEHLFRVEFEQTAVPEGGESAALTLGVGLALWAWKRRKAVAGSQA